MSVPTAKCAYLIYDRKISTAQSIKRTVAVTSEPARDMNQILAEKAIDV